MFKKTCKTLGYMNNIVCKITPGGGNAICIPWPILLYGLYNEFKLKLNIDNPYFEQTVGQIYPTELQLNKANSSDTEAPFLDLNLSITNDIVSSKIYDKRMILILK